MIDTPIKIAKDALRQFLLWSGLLLLLLQLSVPLSYALDLNESGFRFFASAVLFVSFCVVLKGLFQCRACFLQPIDRSNYLLLTVLLVVVLMTLLQAMVLPVVARDALVHHLAVPNYWRQHGSPVEIAWHSWSYYPMLVQTVYAGLLGIHESYCTLLHGTFLLLSLELIFLFTFLLTSSTRIALSSAFILGTTPLLLNLASSPLIDIALLFFCTASLASLYIDCRGLVKVLLAGSFLGAALSTKYNALLFLIAFVPSFWLIERRKGAPLKGILLLASVIMLAIAVNSPWLLKNYLQTDNPLYPLFNSFFNPGATSRGLGSVSQFEKRILLYGETIVEVILLPFRMFLFGQEGNPRRFDGVASPLMLFSWLAFFIPSLRSKHGGFLLLSALFMILALYFGPARIRYILPVIGIMTILSASVLGSWIGPQQSLTRIVFGGLVAFQCLWLVFTGSFVQRSVDALAVATGLLPVESYKEKSNIEYSIINKVNEVAGTKDCTYLLYTGNLFYWYEGCVRSGGHQSGAQLVHTIKAAKDDGDILQFFRQQDITLLLVHNSRLVSILRNNLEKDELQRWSTFTREHLHFLFSEKGYTVWRLAE